MVYYASMYIIPLVSKVKLQNKTKRILRALNETCAFAALIGIIELVILLYASETIGEASVLKSV